MAKSLKDRIAERYEKVHEKRTFVIPVTGYDTLLHACYKPLEIEDSLRIFQRHGGDVNADPDETVAAAADVLINACEDLLEVAADGTETSLGKKWTTSAIADLFPVEVDPEDPSVRNALREALGSSNLMNHFYAYTVEVDTIEKERVEAAVGESQAAPAATSLNSRPELVLPGSR